MATSQVEKSSMLICTQNRCIYSFIADVKDFDSKFEISWIIPNNNKRIMDVIIHFLFVSDLLLK